MVRHLIMVCETGLEACKLSQTLLTWKCQCYEQALAMNKSEFFPTLQIRFSLTTRVFEKFLDNLESLECVLQSIFVMQIETPSGSMWKMAKKLDKNPA